MKMRSQRRSNRVQHRARYLANSLSADAGAETRLFESFEQPLRRERDLHARLATFRHPVGLAGGRNTVRVGDAEQYVRSIPVVARGVLQELHHEPHVERIVLPGTECRFPDAFEAEGRSVAVGADIELRCGGVVCRVHGEHGQQFANGTRVFRRARDRVPVREVEPAADGESQERITRQPCRLFHQLVDRGRRDEQFVRRGYVCRQTQIVQHRAGVDAAPPQLQQKRIDGAQADEWQVACHTSSWPRNGRRRDARK